MAANRHQAAFIAANVSFGKAQIQNHLNRICSRRVLRDPHAPNENGIFRVANQTGEFEHGFTTQACLPFQFFKREIFGSRF